MQEDGAVTQPSPGQKATASSAKWLLSNKLNCLLFFFKASEDKSRMLRMADQGSTIVVLKGGWAGWLYTPGDIRPCLEAFLMGCYWHLSGWKPGMLLNNLQYMGQPHTKNYMVQMSTVPRLRNPALKEAGTLDDIFWAVTPATNHLSLVSCMWGKLIF